MVLFTWNLTNYLNITGEQLGGYFGYSLAVGDIDGDRRDDLIVGAPLYTKPNNEEKYEVGRVYIQYQKDVRTRSHYLHVLHHNCDFRVTTGIATFLTGSTQNRDSDYPWLPWAISILMGLEVKKKL